MTPAEVSAAVAGFSAAYVRDWDWWLTAPDARRPLVLGTILRRWQATRPLPMRRVRAEATHSAPYLEDLYTEGKRLVASLGGLDLVGVARRTAAQETALHDLWTTFASLTTHGAATCVGITKAILLMTDGHIGPAFDSQVRERLSIKRPATSGEWIRDLEAIADDISAFEALHSPLSEVVPPRFGHLATARLYDMALGPR
jgi:hypothetical protein